MLRYVYDRLEELASVANHIVIAGDQRLNHRELKMNLPDIKAFMAELKIALNDYPGAIDELTWLEMVVRSLEAEEEKQQSVSKTNEPEKE